MDLLRKEKMQEQSLEDLKKLQEHKSAGKNRYLRTAVYFYKLVLEIWWTGSIQARRL